MKDEWKSEERRVKDEKRNQNRGFFIFRPPLFILHPFLDRARRSARVSRGYDAGKKIKGRKRHLVVDTLGLMTGVVVQAAGAQDRDGAKKALQKIRFQCPRLAKIWADGG